MRGFSHSPVPTGSEKRQIVRMPTMKSVWIAIMAACLYLSSSGFSEAVTPERMYFPTEQPRLAKVADPGRAPASLLSKEQYAELVEERKGWAPFVPIRTLSSDPRPFVGFGWNLAPKDKNIGFAVRGSEQSGYLVRLDLDADGALDDEDPISLDHKDGYYAGLLKTNINFESDADSMEAPLLMRFVVVPDANGEAIGSRYAVHDRLVRRGTIKVHGKSIKFGLFARGRPIYHYPNSTLWIDLNGDGEMPSSATDWRRSDEVFHVRDEYVNLGGQSYRFEVDRYGRHLALMPQTAELPKRPTLAAGSPAPEFNATGIDGRPQNLKRYEGKVVLLDFWAVWCKPCIEEAPRLAKVHQQYATKGLTILGINPDGESHVRDFIEEHDHDWPQIEESVKGEIHKAYRVVAYPAKFLIDRDGAIICSAYGRGFWENCWPKAEALLNP